MAKQWFVIQTKPAAEAKAAASLEQIGAEIYLPQESQWRKTTKGRIETFRPVIRGYLFALMEEESLWLLYGLDGVYRRVPGIGSYARLLKFIARLRREEGTGIFNNTAAPSFEAGEVVVIVDEAFERQFATFKRMAGPGRARVMFAFLGADREINVDADKLQKLEAA